MINAQQARDLVMKKRTELGEPTNSEERINFFKKLLTSIAYDEAKRELPEFYKQIEADAKEGKTETYFEIIYTHEIAGLAYMETYGGYIERDLKIGGFSVERRIQRQIRKLPYRQEYVKHYMVIQVKWELS